MRLSVILQLALWWLGDSNKNNLPQIGLSFYLDQNERSVWKEKMDGWGKIGNHFAPVCSFWDFFPFPLGWWIPHGQVSLCTFYPILSFFLPSSNEKMSELIGMKSTPMKFGNEARGLRRVYLRIKEALMKSPPQIFFFHQDRQWKPPVCVCMHAPRLDQAHSGRNKEVLVTHLSPFRSDIPRMITGTNSDEDCWWN